MQPEATSSLSTTEMVRRKKERYARVQTLSHRQTVVKRLYAAWNAGVLFEMKMEAHLSPDEIIAVNNLVAPHINALTGISRFCHINPNLPQRPSSMSESVYHYARVWYNIKREITVLNRSNPELACQAFEDWERQRIRCPTEWHDQASTDLQAFCKGCEL